MASHAPTALAARVVARLALLAAAGLAACGLTACGSSGSSSGAIPLRYTCVGDNQSPPLAWSGVPGAAAELAVVVDDPDAPQGTFVHWVLTGLAPTRTALGAGERPPEAVEARGSSGETGYTGPCPPNHQTHRYRFTVYALRSPAGVAPGAPFSAALSAVESRALARGTLTARFGR
jgi:Raf kinase inhibitor-like YbhB/YbcL family protein